MKLHFFTVATVILALAAVSTARDADQTFVYTMSNSTSANEVLAFNRAEDGSLTKVASYATGGKGISGDIDDQHSLRMVGDLIFASNAGSNTVTVFKKSADGLQKVGKYPSGGNNPVSLSVFGKTLLVANQAVKSGTPNITEFNIGMDGSLSPLKTKKISFKAGAGPADVEFSPDGTMVAVSYGFQNESTSYVATYGMDKEGAIKRASRAPAYGPVGLSWNKTGDKIYVSTFRKASILPFSVGTDGKLTALNAITDGEAASCWTHVNEAGTRLYVGNFVSNSVSIYALDAMGSAKFMGSVKRPSVSGNDTKDIVISPDGKFLYILGTTSKRIDAFEVAEDGGLKFLSSTESAQGSNNWKGLAIG